MDKFTFASNIAVVTGTSRGLGEAIACALIDCGIKVHGVSRSGVSEYLQSSERYSHHKLDLLDSAQRKVLLDMIRYQLKPGIVVNNLGGTMNIRSAISSIEDWTKVLGLNFFCALEINNAAIPNMREKGYGRIVNISSIAGDQLRGSAPYACSKSLLNSYTVALAREVAKEGIVISAVQPGSFFSEGGHWDNVRLTDPAKEKDFLKHHQALGRIGNTSEITPFVILLCSDQASFASGALVNIDGGTM